MDKLKLWRGTEDFKTLSHKAYLLTAGVESLYSGEAWQTDLSSGDEKEHQQEHHKPKCEPPDGARLKEPSTTSVSFLQEMDNLVLFLKKHQRDPNKEHSTKWQREAGKRPQTEELSRMKTDPETGQLSPKGSPQQNLLYAPEARGRSWTQAEAWSVLAYHC